MIGNYPALEVGKGIVIVAHITHAGGGDIVSWTRHDSIGGAVTTEIRRDVVVLLGFGATSGGGVLERIEVGTLVGLAFVEVGQVSL